MFATVAGTSVAVDGSGTASHGGHDVRGEQVGSESNCVGTDTTQNPCSSYPVVVTYTDAGWTTRPDGTSQGGQLVFIANSELLQGKESNMSLRSWHSSRLRRVARSSSAAETQGAADGDDEGVYTLWCLKEVLFGQLDLQNWQSEPRQISCCFGG